MLSFPFNASTPILYYNKDQFRVAGLDPDAPPRTWPEVEAAAKKLLAAGVPCGFTTAWPSWINVENLLAVHNQPISTKQNGFGGLDTELMIANDVAVKHLSALAEWQKTKIFDYGGRADRADAKFHGSQCGMYVSSSATRPDILANAKFEVGYGLMPYWPDVASGAAQRDHRRRDAVGAEGAAGRRIQGRGAVLCLSCRGPRCRRAGTRRAATCRSPAPPMS